MVCIKKFLIYKTCQSTNSEGIRKRVHLNKVYHYHIWKSIFKEKLILHVNWRTWKTTSTIGKTLHSIRRKSATRPGKQYITIWAEEKRSLAKDTYEYSFGDGMVGKWAGYTVLTPSKVFKNGDLSFASCWSGWCWCISRSYGVKTKCSILKPLGKFTHVIDTPEIDLRPGDTITFMTDTTAKRITGLLSALLEITL